LSAHPAVPFASLANRFVCQQQRNEIMKLFLNRVNYFFTLFLNFLSRRFQLPASTNHLKTLQNHPLRAFTSALLSFRFCASRQQGANYSNAPRSVQALFEHNQKLFIKPRRATSTNPAESHSQQGFSGRAAKAEPQKTKPVPPLTGRHRFLSPV
jgi:hypothetical protein